MNFTYPRIQWLLRYCLRRPEILLASNVLERIGKRHQGLVLERREDGGLRKQSDILKQTTTELQKLVDVTLETPVKQ